MLSSDPKSSGPFRLLLILLLLAPLSAQGQPTQQPTAPAGFTIRDIRVEGASPATRSAVIQFSGLRVGDVIRTNSDVLQRAIRNLMERGAYSNVQILFDDIDETNGSVVVVIRVEERPRVGMISVAGNEEFDETELRDDITLRPGVLLSRYEVSRSMQRIRARYAAEGYVGTRVDTLISQSADSGRLDVLFQIDEGTEAHIGDITFEGNSAIDDADLRGAMEDVTEKSWWQFWKSSTFKRDALEADVQRVENYYHSQGFIDAEVTDVRTDVDSTTGETDITMTVQEGSRVYLRSLTLTGNEAYPDQVIRRRLDVGEGEAYNQVRLEQNLNGNEDQTDVRSLYYDNGYLQFAGRLVENRVGDSVDVVVTMNEGGQSEIRYVSIVGNTKTKDKVIRRELYTRPGDTFSKAAVIRSLRGLANLNYFNPERLQPRIEPVDNTRVDVTYEVEERPSDTFNASIGLSSQGLTGMLGVSFNNFSLTEPLLGGGGQVLNFNWEFGTYQTTFALGLTEPWLFDDPTSLGFNVYYQTRDVAALSSGSDYKLRQIGAALNLGRRLRWPDDYFRVDFGVNYRRNQVTGSAESIYYRNGTELTFGTTLSRTSIDNPIFPSNGSRFVLGNTFAGIGDAEYNKTELKYDFYSTVARPTETNPLVFYLGSEFGYLYDYGDRSTIPPLSFYSMGGTAIGALNVTPLRGYRDGSIGPVQGGVAVGQVYSKITGELRFGVSLNPIPIYLLAFAEAGNVWGSFSQVDPFDLRRSAGAGVRITIPGVGLLGFDYGYGFDIDSQGLPGGWQFHFQFGR